MSYTYPILCLFIQQILSVYDEPYIVLGSETTVMNETAKTPAPTSIHSGHLF